MKYIKHSNLPPKLPIHLGLFWFLLCHYFGAPGWVYGVLGTVWALLFLAELVRLWNGDAVDILKD